MLRFIQNNWITTFLLAGLLVWAAPLAAQEKRSETVPVNPININIKPQTPQGQPAKTVDRFLPGQSVKMEGGGEVRIFSDDGRIQITAQNGTVIQYEGMVAGASKPWMNDQPVLVRDASAGSEAELVPQFRISVGEAEIQVQTGQELRVATPMIISAVRGTKFTMRVQEDGSSFLDVAEGKVLSMVRNGQVELLEAGKKISLSAAAFTDFLRSHNIRIPTGGDWRSVDINVINQKVSEAFGDSLNILNSGVQTVRDTAQQLSDKIVQAAPKQMPHASGEARKEMVAVP
ncbi:MAG: FecR family protein [Deltaproteobacteria bacterium]|nr:FecR family protein [Deltaproteobacteria bacterium]